MRINSKLETQHATFDGCEAGEGLAVFFSQNGLDTCRYRFLVKAILSDGVYEVGEFYSSPPQATPVPGSLTRMLAGAVCPGAKSWAVEVTCIPIAGVPIVPETAEILLASSRVIADIGVKRVGERYAYYADTGNVSTLMIPGQRVTGIACVALSGGGSLQVGATGNLISIPAGQSANLAPDGKLAPNTVITVVNCDYVIEYLESA